MKYDTVIKNGTIVDGTRAPRFIGDIGIRNGVIETVGFVDEANAGKIIDATGLVVAPGFIDLHTHYDAQIYWDPYCTMSGWHGVTSVVVGNCGFGFAPMQPEYRDRAMLSMTRVEAVPYESMKAALPWDWVTFSEYMDSMDKTKKAVNIVQFVPLSPLITWVLGPEDAKAGRMPTAAEHGELCRLLDEAMDAGGCGWSAQRQTPGSGSANQTDYDGTPMVTDVMHDETYLELAKVLRRRNEGVVQLLYRSGSDETDEKFYEDLARESRRPILMNVVRAMDSNPEFHRQKLRWISDCRERGLRVIPQGATLDSGFTFSLADWNLFDEAPAWREATLGTVEERKAKFADPVRREALKRDRLYLFNLDNIVVCGPVLEKNKRWLDYPLKMISEQTGKHVVDVMLDMAVEEGLETDFYATIENSSLDHLREMVTEQSMLLGVSDGGAHTRFLTAGRYPTDSIIRMVRENDILTLEEVHWRLSTLPAMCVGMTDRGTLTAGSAADIVIYDFDNLNALRAEVLTDLPARQWRRVQRATGYRFVLVNGEVTIQDDSETNVYSGELLRNGVGKRSWKAGAHASSALELA